MTYLMIPSWSGCMRSGWRRCRQVQRAWLRGLYTPRWPPLPAVRRHLLWKCCFLHDHPPSPRLLPCRKRWRSGQPCSARATVRADPSICFSTVWQRAWLSLLGSRACCMLPRSLHEPASANTLTHAAAAAAPPAGTYEEVAEGDFLEVSTIAWPCALLPWHLHLIPVRRGRACPLPRFLVDALYIRPL